MTTVQIRSRGKITIPAQLRSKYQFQEGDSFTLIDLEDGSFLLKPGISKVDEISEKIEKSFQEEGITLEVMFETLREIRKELFQEKYGKFIKVDSSKQTDKAA
jgi:AbrB family looped-hinge helix DNA binding protein